jgi:hypothetical protein
MQIRKKGGWNLKKIFFSETTEPISTKLCWNDPWVVPFQISFEEISIFSNGGHLGYRTALTDTILKGDHPRIISAKFGWDWFSSFRGEDLWNLKKIFFSETTEPISTKLCWNDPWVVPFQIYVRQRRPVSKMAAITKNRNFFKWPKLLYWDWFSSFRGEDFFLISSPLFSNLHNRSK